MLHTERSVPIERGGERYGGVRRGPRRVRGRVGTHAARTTLNIYTTRPGIRHYYIQPALHHIVTHIDATSS